MDRTESWYRFYLEAEQKNNKPKQPQISHQTADDCKDHADCQCDEDMLGQWEILLFPEQIGQPLTDQVDDDGARHEQSDGERRRS